MGIFGRSRVRGGKSAGGTPRASEGWGTGGPGTPPGFRPEVDAAFDGLYPGLVPARIAVPRGTGITGVAAYPVMSEEGVFWHYVSHGLSTISEDDDAYAEVADPEVSGYGLEWTLRAAGDITRRAPDWPVRLIGSLSAHVRGGAPVAPGMHLRFVAPYTGDERAQTLSAVVLRVDPAFAPIDGAEGRFALLQAVTVDDETYERIAAEGPDAVIAELRDADRLCVTPL